MHYLRQFALRGWPKCEEKWIVSIKLLEATGLYCRMLLTLIVQVCSVKGSSGNLCCLAGPGALYK